jgi:hypothetical protein
MTYLNESDFEIIFDPVSKGAVLRRGENTTYLDGPFRTFLDAVVAARAYIAKLQRPRKD